MAIEIPGVKVTFGADGADRMPVDADYSQLSHVALRLMAETQHEGNTKYGYGNWQKGLPISNLLTHAIEHILKLQNGEGDGWRIELGHALWNLEKAAHFIETRPDLIDVLPIKKAMNLGQSSTSSTAPARSASLADIHNVTPPVSASVSGASAAVESGGTSEYRRCNQFRRGCVCVLESGHPDKCVTRSGYLFDPAPNPRQG